MLGFIPVVYVDYWDKSQHALVSLSVGEEEGQGQDVKQVELALRFKQFRADVPILAGLAISQIWVEQALLSSFSQSKPPAPQHSCFGRPTHSPTLRSAKTSTHVLILTNPSLTVLVFAGPSIHQLLGSWNCTFALANVSLTTLIFVDLATPTPIFVFLPLFLHVVLLPG